MEALQNRAFDIIDSSRLKDSWERTSLNVNQLMNFFDCSLMTCKLLNNHSPEILQNKSSISKYNTGSIRDLHFQRLSLEWVKRDSFIPGNEHGTAFHNPSKMHGQQSHSKKSENSFF